MLTVTAPKSDEARDLWFWLRGECDGTETQCCNVETSLTPRRSKLGYWVAALHKQDKET